MDTPVFMLNGPLLFPLSSPFSSALVLVRGSLVQYYDPSLQCYALCPPKYDDDDARYLPAATLSTV